MPVGTNPRNTANFSWDYSTDGVNFVSTSLSSTVDVRPDPQMTKIIERRVLGSGIVDKFPGRVDYGSVTHTWEYSSTMFALVAGWRDNKTLIYWRGSADDTGGGNNSKHVFGGYIQELGPPNTPGDDATAEVVFKHAVKSYTFTPAA